VHAVFIFLVTSIALLLSLNCSGEIFIPGDSCRNTSDVLLGGAKILMLYWRSDIGMNVKKNQKNADELCRLRGSAVYKINLYKHLIQYGFNVVLLGIDDDGLCKELADSWMPCYALTTQGVGKPVNQDNVLFNKLYEICMRDDIKIIHCHTARETRIAKRIAQKLPVSVVMTLHIDKVPPLDLAKNVDGVICVSPRTEDKINYANQLHNLNIKEITWLPPFFDEDKFLKFKPTLSKANFFRKNFNIALSDAPIICSVANFYKGFKNHAVLLRAVKKLIDDYQQPVQLLLAGIGDRLEGMKRLAEQLQIADKVHFLGLTTKTPELYYYADINALTSDSEALGIVLLEGALLKKPMVGTRGTGMEAVIRHGENGLLFERRNADDLAECLYKLLSDAAFSRRLGMQAYKFVGENFLSGVTINKLRIFYEKIVQASSLHTGNACCSSMV
jgi:glycosyltransferase involved in cell wall biosynthesis